MNAQRLDKEKIILRTQPLFWLLLFCFSAVVTTEVVAQDTDDQVLEEVIVTATKTGEVNLQDTPISITSFSREMLDNANVDSITALTEFVPNAQFEWLGFRMVGYIRGIGSRQVGQSAESPIGYYLDGVFLERGWGANFGFQDIERVEVLRGPQGTLYGRNTTGGAVSFITKRPGDELEVELGLQAGNYGMKMVDASIGGPLANEGDIKARVSFSYGAHDPYIKNLAGPDFYDDDYKGVRGSIEWAPSERLEIILRGDYFDSDTRGFTNKLISNTGSYYARALAAGFPESILLPDDFWTAAIDADVGNVKEFWGFSVTASFKLSDHQNLRSITAYRNDVFGWVQDADATPIKQLHAFYEVDSPTFSQELQLDGSSGHWNWLVGAYYLHNKENEDQNIEFEFVRPGLARIHEQNFSTDAAAFFGNATYAINDKLSLNAGLRYSYEKKKVSHYRTYPTLPFPAWEFTETPQSENWDALTPKIGMEYRLSGDALLYASFSEGFKSGLYFSTNPVEAKWVDPEYVNAYEVGFKTEWFDNRLRLNGAVFYNELKDIQVRTVDISQNLRIMANAAKATIKGFELEFMAVPIANLDINGSISHLDAEYDEFISQDRSGRPLDVSGNRLEMAPEWKLTLGAQYALPVGEYGFLTLRGDWSWIDDHYFDQFQDPLAEQTSYSLLSALVRFEPTGGRWRVELFAKNLAEKEYYTNLAVSSNDVLGSLGAPRTYGLQVNFAF